MINNAYYILYVFIYDYFLVLLRVISDFNEKKFDSDYLFDLRHKINKEINFKQPRFFILKKRNEEKTSQKIEIF